MPGLSLSLLFQRKSHNEYLTIQKAYIYHSIFQHYRLFTAYHSIQPELVQLQETKKIGTPFTPQPLAESQTLEAYEIELGISPEFSMNKETDLYGNDQNDTEDNEEKPKEEDGESLNLCFWNVEVPDLISRKPS